MRAPHIRLVAVDEEGVGQVRLDHALARARDLVLVGDHADAAPARGRVGLDDEHGDLRF